jgi:hypothetical protein
MPNGATVIATHKGLLNFPQLPPSARIAYVFPDLQNSLLSIGMLCDHGLIAQYDQNNVTIFNPITEDILLSGSRQRVNKMWMLPIVNNDGLANLSIQSTHDGSINNVLAIKTIAKQVEFYHAAFGSPTPSTFIKAVSQHFISLPNISLPQVRKYTPTTFPSMAGHLDQQRQHPNTVRHTPTPTTPLPYSEDHDDNFVPVPAADELHANEGILFLAPLASTKAFMDLTGRFPVQSRSGHNYMLIIITDDHNYIHIEPMKNRSAPEYVRAFTTALAFFNQHGTTFSSLHMDNETSTEIETTCRTAGIRIQYVPPNVHRANRAERAIRTFKNHLIATLAGAHAAFPLSLWDRILEQVELTLNLLRPAHSNPAISAYHALRGQYDFIAHPFAPIGMRVAVHLKASIRSSWEQHAARAYYLGPALLHYKCHRVWITTTNAERITDTLDWFPHDSTLCDPPTHLQPLPQQLHQLADNIQQQLLQATFSATDLDNLPNAISTLSTHLATLLHATTQAKHHKPRSMPDAAAPPPDNQRVSPSTVPTVPNHTLPTTNTDADNQRVLSAPVPVANNQRVLSAPVPAPSFLVPPTSPPGLAPRNTHYNLRTVPPVHYTASLSLDPDAVPQPSSYAEAMRGPYREQFERAHAEEFIRLIETWQAMHFVPASTKPPNVKATYYSPQVKVKMSNGELQFRVRGTVGGDKVHYDGYRSSYTASLSTVKLHLNATVSEGADYITADIKDYYLGSPMPDGPVFMWIPLRLIPQDIQDKYDLLSLAVNGQVMVQVDKGMYGLPHAGKLAQDRLIPHLAKHGYHQCPNTRCLFKHETRPISFTLVVDDFGIKYHGKENADHLIASLSELYTMTVDWTGSKYLGIVIHYDKEKREMHLSMPKYVENAIERFGAKDYEPAHSPMLYVPPSRNSNQMTNPDLTPPLPPDRKQRIQQIVGTFLYYARAVDPTMLTAINKLASIQANPTEATELAVHRFLSYAKTWPHAYLVIRPSDMILHAHSDASHLSESESRSRIGGFIYLGHSTMDPDQPPNAAVEYFSTIIDVKVSSAAEAEYAALFQVAKECEPLRETLNDLGYPQPPTLITCDNQCAVSIAYDTVKQKRSKAVDMRFHWIRDRIRQGHFKVEWQPGSTNLADFFTKAHSCKHHTAVRHLYVHDPGPPLAANNAKTRHVIYQLLRELSNSTSA